MTTNTMTAPTVAESSSKVAEGLNITVANAIVSYQKLHHYHWRVIGEQFFDLHDKFEQLYDRFADILDDVAERMLMIDAAPVKTLGEAVSLATIQEETETPPPVEMVARTIADLKTQRDQMIGVIAEAEQVGDRSTVNLLDGIIDALDKEIWMLRAYNAS